ncbi:MAG: 3-oxoacid CoA-transferase subunit B [Bacteroidetes bacterium]|nr:MAG: 3-oxoacid CoA-transferase subunit B [Bacteroidota bacterium]
MKQVPQITVEEAVRLVKEGDTLLCGGFGMTGYPVHLVHALANTRRGGLTYVGNNAGEVGLGAGRLLQSGLIRKMICSYFTSNPHAVKAIQAGEVEYELLPQGTLAEALRAGGAGLGGFFTPTAAYTQLAAGKEVRLIDGKTYVLEKPIRGDVAFIRAWKADTAGNLQYRRTEQNFNRAMATAARLVIAEVEQIVPAGELAPAHIHTPACYVDYLVQAHTRPEELGSSASLKSSSRKADPARLRIARRAFEALRPGQLVNLGIGLPTLVADFIEQAHGIILHSENGMLGVGPAPADGGGAMHYPVNASKVPVTALRGSSYFDSADSFAMIRGGHIDVAIMGGLQVDQHGNLANWAVPGRPVLGVGGAMDLASGARRLIVTMLHTNRQGHSKVVPQCTLPLTAKAAVDLLITELGVFTFERGRMQLIELMPGVDLPTLMAHTSASFENRLE